MNFVTIVYSIMFFFGIYFTVLFLVLYYKNRNKLNYYPKPSRYPSVSFIVPAYNEEDSIADTLTALLDIKYPRGKKEIIVVNDGSKDNTEKIVKTFLSHSEIKYIKKKNTGKADSLNQGIKIARGELIAVVDADSYPNSDALLKMIGYFEEEGVAAVTSRVLLKNKTRLLNKFDLMDYSIIAWTRKLLDFINSVYVTNGPLSVYRKDIVKKIGGFDKKNMTEDIEITWNLLSKGYKTRMSYSAIVYTHVPEKLSQWIRQRVRWNLGGFQTLQKYWKVMIEQPTNVLGSIVVPYVTLSFVLAFLGLFLLLRYLWITGSFQIVSLYYFFKGYSYFKFYGFNFYLTLLFLFGLLFMILSLVYYKIGFKNSETGNKSIISILLYSFIFRPLYLIPLIIAVYKLVKGDIRWYTK